jgi:hypothetical protein
VFPLIVEFRIASDPPSDGFAKETPPPYELAPPAVFPTIVESSIVRLAADVGAPALKIPPPRPLVYCRSRSRSG